MIRLLLGVLVLAVAVPAAGQHRERDREGALTYPVEAEGLDELKAHLEGGPLDLDSYEAWKGEQRDRWGVSFALSYSVVAQWGSRSEKRSFAGHTVEFVGIWESPELGPFGHGALDMVVSQQLTYSSKTNTSRFAAGQSLVVLPNDRDTDPGRSTTAIEVLWWEHHLFDDALVLLFGQVDPEQLFLQDPELMDDQTTFLAQPFSSVPAANWVGSIGLGFGASLDAENLYLNVMYLDATANGETPDFNSLFDGGFHTIAETGGRWEIPELGKGSARLNFSVTRRTGRAAEERDGWGLYASLAQELGSGVGVFARYGRSFKRKRDVEQVFATGLTWKTPFDSDDLFGFGFFWERPSKGDLRDEYGVELFWRLQITQRLQITPDLQLIVDPARRRSSFVAIGGLRARLIF